MSDHRDTLERELARLSPPRIPFDELARRRDRKRRDERIRAGVLGLAIMIAVVWLGVEALRSVSEVPADPVDPVELGIFGDVRGWITYGSFGNYEGDTRPDGRWGIWAVDPANPDTPPLQLSAKDGYPVAWSRDGSKLLIHRPSGPLVVLHADGSETKVIGSTRPSGGSFTPDGSRIVYAAGAAADETSWKDSGIYVVDATGGTPQLLYAAGRRPEPDAIQMGVFAASLSPDGSRIAYVEGMWDWGNSVWVMNSDGTDRRQIIGEEVGIRPDWAFPLQWAPDGTRLVVESAEDIYVVDADGSALTLLGEGQDWTLPSWSPDGSRIAFQRYTDVGQDPESEATLYSMAPDGSDVRSLGHVIHPETNYGPWSYLGAWNPLAP